MNLRKRYATLAMLAHALACLAPAAVASAQSLAGPPNLLAVTVTAPAREPPFLGRSDLVFGVVAAAAVALTSHHDMWLRREAIEADTRLDRNLASTFQPLGNPTFVVPALLAGYGLARALDARDIAAGFTEVGLSVLAAGGGALVLKEAVGRGRPEDSPHDALSFDPFSGQSSFPSGHATVAFALAESIHLTSGSAWAPWLAYPAAAMVGWSRVRDDHHWTSDVVAGAALGVWTARKVHRLYRMQRHTLTHFELAPCTPGGAPGWCVTLR